MLLLIKLNTLSTVPAKSGRVILNVDRDNPEQVVSVVKGVKKTTIHNCTDRGEFEWFPTHD